MRRRRNKPQGDRKPTNQRGAPPLQPMYPEFSGPGSTSEHRQEPPEAPMPERPEPRAEAVEPPEPVAPESAQAAPSDQRRPRRRRGRGRGGRGRQRPGAPEAAVAQPPSAGPEVAAETAPPPEVIEPAALAPAPSAPAAAPVPAAPRTRPSRGVVVLTIGLPGSGKSSWFRRRSITPLSSDLLRTLLFDSITEQRYQDLVFSSLRSLLRARLIARMPWNYVDATNLAPKERRGWVKMAREFGYEVHAVFFDVPLEVCQERNRRRLRVVPDDVMQRMAAKLRPPTFEEGFSKITVVRVKPKDGEAQPAHAATPEAEGNEPYQEPEVPEEPEPEGF